MKFAVLSDIHYISPGVIMNDEKARIASAVSTQALYDAAGRDDIDTILIHGDLTDRGDKPSHLGLIEILRDIKSKGKRVYVTTATHDFCHHRAFTRKRGDTSAEFVLQPWNLPYFDETKADYSMCVKEKYRSLPPEEISPSLVECFTPHELWELYREFGRDDAYSVEDSGYSYCIELDDKTRCLMLNDNFRNEEALHDISVTYSPACLRWIKRMKDEADRDGKFIFACTHHPLVPPSPAYRVGAGDRDMRSPYSAHVLADIGINLVFTGHTHFSDVGFAVSDCGNSLCDISTPSVRFYPPRYREVDLDGAAGKVSYKCITVSKPEGVSIKEENLEDYFRRELYEEYRKKIVREGSPVEKIVDKKVKDVYFLFRHNAKLSKQELEEVGGTTLFDLVLSAAFNMLSGDGRYTPDTPEYKLLMSIAAFADSLADTQPFINVRKKYLKGYSVSQVMEPLCFSNLVPDNEGEIEFGRIPGERIKTEKLTSHAGDILMLVIYILAVILSPLLPLAAVIGLPVFTVKKKKEHRSVTLRYRY